MSPSGSSHQDRPQFSTTTTSWSAAAGSYNKDCKSDTDVLSVIHEEFVHARAVTLGRVLDDLGVDPRELDGPKGPMLRQADDLSQDWVSRFREEDAEHQLTS